MSAHRPKTMALMAYCEGLLSKAGAERLERHLAHCEPCRRQLAAMRLYETMRREAAEASYEPNWDRMELPLRREATRQARRLRARRGPLRWGVPLAVAAAAVLGVVLLDRSPQEPSSPPVATNRSAPPVAPPTRPAATDTEDTAKLASAAVEATVTAVSGEASIVGADGTHRPALPGAAVATGETLVTAAGGTVHVRVGAGTGFALGGASRVRLLAADGHATVLDLLEGEVHNRVAPLGPKDRYEVLGGTRWAARVRGTRFTVRRPDGGFAVAVAEGTVEVTDDGRLTAMLWAPITWTSAPSTEAPGVEDVGAPWLPACNAPGGCPDSLADWPMVELPAVERVEAWAVGDIHFGPRLWLRAPPGRLLVHALGRDGRRIPLPLEVQGRSVRPDEHALAKLADRLAPPPQGTIDPEALRRAVQAVRPALQRCHRRALKERPALAERGSLRLEARLTIGRSGVLRRLVWRTPTS